MRSVLTYQGRQALEQFLRKADLAKTDAELATEAGHRLKCVVSIGNVFGMRRILGHTKNMRHLLRRQDVERLEKLLAKHGRAVVYHEPEKRIYMTTWEVAQERKATFIPKKGYVRNGHPVDATSPPARRGGSLAPVPTP